GPRRGDAATAAPPGAEDRLAVVHGRLPRHPLAALARGRETIRAPASYAVALAGRSARPAGREAAAPGAARLPPRPLLSAPDAGAGPAAGGRARPGRSPQAALPHQGRRARAAVPGPAE